MTGYGKIDYLWFDGCIPENIDGGETIAMLRELQPEMLINNRLGSPFDIKVCEQTINPAAPGQAWEACMTLNDNWGYHAGDRSWKNPAAVVSMLMTCARSSGNLLLNVGPKADGTIPEESVRILDAVGDWLKRNREAITDTERSPFTWNNTARLITVKGNRIYITFEHEPGGQFCWSELKTVSAAHGGWMTALRSVSVRRRIGCFCWICRRIFRSGPRSWRWRENPNR